MDRKSIIVLIVSFLLIMGWFELVKVMYPPRPAAHGTNIVARATNDIGTNGPITVTNRPAAPPREVPSFTAPTPGATLVQPKAVEKTLTLETAETRYTFTSHGGGVKLIELKKFKESTGKDSANADKLATLNAHAPVPVLALIGGDALQDEEPFTLTKSEKGVRAEKLLTNGLFLVKEFTPGTNYLLHVSARLENRSGRALALPAQEWVMGTATPINAQDNGLLMGLNWYNGTKAQEIGDGWFANRTLGCFPGTPRQTYTEEGKVVWAAVHNRFFTTIAMPKEPAPQVVTRKIELPRLAGMDPKAAIPLGFQSALLYPSATLGAETNNNVVEREFTLFLGPKEYNNLAKLGLHFQNNVDLVMGYSGFFGFFAKALLLSMNGLHSLGLPYALCIICITVIIKLLFWPLTAASTKSMKRMQELQPQMKVIQEKYKDDKTKMNQKMMEFYKENKVNPMSGCLPMVIQIPVFFGFYTMLQSAIELRGESFLWAFDLSQSDTVGVVFGLPINPMPLIMGATMLWQSSLTPPSPGMDPMQQKMMKYMPVMFIFMLYSMAAALTLYWTVQNLLTILQMKLTNAKATAIQTPVVVVPPKKKAKS